VRSWGPHEILLDDRWMLVKSGVQNFVGCALAHAIVPTI